MKGLIVDNFAGGGGASTGLERALGRSVDVAINHDPEAVAMHVANHPDTRHFCQSIMAIDPQDACTVNGTVAKVRLAWFSPDCKHHSKAKGGKPREKNIRDLAWVVVHWPERLGPNAPDVIMLENVEEFRKWGPLDEHGQPIKERQGEEFDLWVRRLKRCGYKVEWRELIAADYGAPTTRKRLYLIARRDGQPIAWPKATHGKRGTEAVESGDLLPWRSAAECIDWSLPCPSIFERKRPLKPNTLRRIAHGTMRYVVNAARPFIVATDFPNTRASRIFDPEDPLRTQTAQPSFGVVVPHVTKFRGGAIGSDAGEPMPTVTANGTPQRPAGAQPLALASASMVPVTHAGGEHRAYAPDAPFPTVTGANRGEIALAGASLVQMGYGERKGQAPRALDAETPLGTVVAGGAKHGLAVAHMEKFSENSRGRPVDAPLDAVMAGAPRHAQVATFLSQFRGSNRTGSGGDLRQPSKAATAGGQHQAVVAAHIEQANGGPRNGKLAGRPATAPFSTVTGSGSQQRIVETTLIVEGDLPPELMIKATRTAAFLVKYYGNENDGHDPDEPLGTVTTKDRFAVVTVTIDSALYVIVDIGMRMLTPRELARAQGFPDDYVLDPVGPKGRPLPKSAQIRMIGNSVCPDVAAALVRSNLVEANPESVVEAA
ncbi:DNA cytosine methyltransferase [Qipengyuania sp.]|uniref:DNA cytosine methyltransferase n=1 Tax=Qipengyuania sp. TaxID=2004515 RepID=UPI0035C79F29